MESIISFDEFTEDEIEVSEILCGLREQHQKTWYFNKWNPKGRRSSLLNGSAIHLPIGIGQRPGDGRACDPRPSTSSGPAARDSPDSPLFFHSESSDKDDKPSGAKKVSMEATTQDCTDERINELTERKRVLTGELENVRNYYKKLKGYNSELKAMKEEVLNKKEEPSSGGSGINLRLELTQYYQTTPMVMPHNHIPDPSAQIFNFSSTRPEAQRYPYDNGLGSSNRVVGPRGFDLNLPPEEAFAAADMEMEHKSSSLAQAHARPFDETTEMTERRARSADARRRRKGIMKIKSLRSACGIKLPSDGL